MSEERESWLRPILMASLNWQWVCVGWAWVEISDAGFRYRKGLQVRFDEWRPGFLYLAARWFVGYAAIRGYCRLIYNELRRRLRIRTKSKKYSDWCGGRSIDMKHIRWFGKQSRYKRLHLASRIIINFIRTHAHTPNSGSQNRVTYAGAAGWIYLEFMPSLPRMDEAYVNKNSHENEKEGEGRA